MHNANLEASKGPLEVNTLKKKKSKKDIVVINGIKYRYSIKKSDGTIIEGAAVAKILEGRKTSIEQYVEELKKEKSLKQKITNENGQKSLGFKSLSISKEASSLVFDEKSPETITIPHEKANWIPCLYGKTSKTSIGKLYDKTLNPTPPPPKRSWFPCFEKNKARLAITKTKTEENVRSCCLPIFCCCGSSNVVSPESTTPDETVKELLKKSKPKNTRRSSTSSQRSARRASSQASQDRQELLEATEASSASSKSGSSARRKHVPKSSAEEEHARFKRAAMRNKVVVGKSARIRGKADTQTTRLTRKVLKAWQASLEATAAGTGIQPPQDRRKAAAPAKPGVTKNPGFKVLTLKGGLKGVRRAMEEEKTPSFHTPEGSESGVSTAYHTPRDIEDTEAKGLATLSPRLSRKAQSLRGNEKRENPRRRSLRNSPRATAAINIENWREEAKAAKSDSKSEEKQEVFLTPRGDEGGGEETESFHSAENGDKEHEMQEGIIANNMRQMITEIEQKLDKREEGSVADSIALSEMTERDDEEASAASEPKIGAARVREFFNAITLKWFGSTANSAPKSLHGSPSAMVTAV